MNKNMGAADRIVRILVAVLVGYLYYEGIVEGTLAYVLLALAGIFLLTSLINFCPLYTLFGISTSGKKNA
jgi:TM2 domain-containing membrane protein YozV